MIIKGDPSAASKVRVDGKCGASFPLADGSPAECNVASNDYCCSEWGFCGSTDLHCKCEKCVNYRTLERDGKFSSFNLFSFFIFSVMHFETIIKSAFLFSR